MYVQKKKLLKIMTVDSLVTPVLIKTKKPLVVSFHIEEAVPFSALVAAFFCSFNAIRFLFNFIFVISRQNCTPP